MRYRKKEIPFFIDLGLSVIATIAAILFSDAGDSNTVVLTYGAVSLIVSALLILAFGLQRNIVRCFGVTDLLQILLYSISKSSVVLMLALALKYQSFALNVAFLDFMLTVISITTARVCLVMGVFGAVDHQTSIPQCQIKPVQIEDLLHRDEIQIDLHSIENEIQGKVVMITGAAGSIGSEIVRQVALFGARRLILFELAETALHELQLKMRRKFPNLDVKYILGDVRSKQRVKTVIEQYKPNIIFHAAAYKHVPMIEKNPCEGVMTNVWGTVNVAQRAIENGVEKFVMISTDKAVNPTSVMGATKRIAEMCVQSMNRQNKTAFITTRFGNVLGSNGSVIPLFRQQIAVGGPVTVTHPDITRYFMSIPEACSLVLQAATMGHAGEILVFDMGKPEKIVKLARKMIKLSGFEPDCDIKIEYIGLRPGEKLYEELFSSDEDMATSHKKINIAKCREINHDLIEKTIKRLALHARQTDVEATVRLMKLLVPEFISQNSEFEKLDI